MSRSITLPQIKAQKPSKYRNRKVTFLNIPFDSHKEANRYMELLLMERTGDIRNIELQPRYDLVVDGEHICYYSADFRYQVVETDLTVVEDVKGVRTSVYQLKKKLMKALYGIEVVEI